MTKPPIDKKQAIIAQFKHVLLEKPTAAAIHQMVKTMRVFDAKRITVTIAVQMQTGEKFNHSVKLLDQVEDGDVTPPSK